jgi:beta-ureidopropionase / N-carbamoyl-L-amino-acid hydrolase
VTFTVDFRHPDEGTLTNLGDQIEVVAQASAGPCEVKVTEIRRERPTHFEGIVPETILEMTQRLGYPCMHIPSGAGHDARYIAEISQTGMIFIPCWRGISHNEAESATPHDVAAGARVLANTLIELANR